MHVTDAQIRAPSVSGTGIEHDIKVWAPTAESPHRPGLEAYAAMDGNR